MNYVRTLIYTLLALTILSLPIAAATQCKLIVASRTLLNEARVVANEYENRFSDVELLESKNGLFAISLGTLNVASGSDMSTYINRYNLPSDSFCMRMDKVVRYIPVINASQPSNNVAPTENSFGMKSCPRGYSGNGYPIINCSRLVLPANAELGATGNNWKCRLGYFRREQQCELIDIPENAHLTSNSFFAISDDNGWACDRGFREINNSCEKIYVPQNAKLNSLGSGYKCNLGFANTGSSCRAKNYGELIVDLQTAEQNLFLAISNMGKSCSKIVDLCEKTCDDDFSYSSSPNKRECEKVCKAIKKDC